jgi:hypothetical protein
MKKIFTPIAILLSTAVLFAQPVLHSDSLHTGLSFNLYSLNNVNTANLAPAGANITWDISSATATLAGTADFLDMASTPYETDYPAANFAMKFTAGGTSKYSLFNLSNTVLEEVANNVGTASPVSFTNYRTSLVFSFTFGLTNTDTYQKITQGTKTINNTYDSYGTFISNSITNINIVRILTVDDGNTSINWWSTTPLAPLFQASGDGFILWELTSNTTGITEMSSNKLFDMYPNPATDVLNIINKELISKIEIYDVVGKLQLTTVTSAIDISALKKGIFLVKAYSKNGTVTQKFIKK